MAYQPENPGVSIKPEWMMRELSRVSEEIEIASRAGADQWTAKANNVTGNIWEDVNAMDWTGHPHSLDGTSCLQITTNDIVTFGNDTGNAYIWAGPKPVLLGAGCPGAYISGPDDFVGVASVDHEILLNRESPNQHPQSAITGLESRLTQDETNLANHIADKDNNPHNVKHEELGDVTPDQHHSMEHTHDGSPEDGGSIPHNNTTSRDAADCHPQSAITGLTDRLDGYDDHVADTDNPHGVTWEQTGAAPLVHTHVEEDITDLDRVRSRGAWANQQYFKNDMAEQDGYMAVALVDTMDPLAPQPVGNPLYLLPDIPVWSPESSVAVVTSGIHVTNLTRAVRISRIRVWVPNVTENASYRLVVVDNLTGVMSIGSVFTGTILSSPGWLDVTLNPSFLTPGADMSFLLVSSNTADSSVFDYPWIYNGVDNTGADPGSGNTTRNQQHTLLYISKTGSDLVDRSVELSNVIAGTSIRIVSDTSQSAFFDYEVLTTPTDNGTYYTYSVALVETGAAGPPPIGPAFNHFDIPVLAATDYVELVNYFLGHATITGILEYDGVPQPGHEANAFGVDLEVQEYTVSPDWYIYSAPGGVSTSGEQETTPVDNDPVQLNTGHAISSDWAYQHQEGFKSQHDHSDLTGIGINDHAQIDAHIADTNNPHQTSWDSLVGKPILGWRVENGDYDTAAWGEKIRFDTPPNYVQLPAATIPPTGVDNADILIWNNGAQQGQAIEIRPAAGHHFTLDGFATVKDAPAYINPGEVFRLSSRVENDSYGVAIDAMSGFDGAGTSGFVRNPGTESGRFLADDGTWTAVVAPPVGGLELRYKFQTAVTNTPPAGYARINNIDPELATEIYVNEVTQNGNAFTLLLQSLQNSDVIWFADQIGGNTYGYKIAAPGVQNAGVFTFSILDRLTDGLIPNEADIKFTLMRNPQERIPPGGLENEVLAKSSSTDYATYWMDVDDRFVGQADVPQDGKQYAQWWDGDSYEWAATHWQQGQNAGQIYYSDGDVGIGTNDPLAALHVLTSGSHGASMDFTGSWKGGVWFGGFNSAGSNGAGCGQLQGWHYHDSTGAVNSGYNDISVNAGDISHLYITTNGNVGIGTTSPSAKLDVRDGGGITASNSAPWSAIGENGGTLTLSGRYDGASTIPVGFGRIIGATDIAGNSGAGSLQFQTTAAGAANNFSTKMIIKNTGNVGIGTTSPSAKLHVSSGSSSATNRFSSDVHSISNFCRNAVIGLNWSAAWLDFQAYSTGTTYVTGARIQAVGAGQWSSTSTPMSLAFHTVPASSTSLAEVMRIHSNGNVGIGTTTPAHALDVAGNIHSQGNIAAGGIDWNQLGKSVSIMYDEDGAGVGKDWAYIYAMDWDAVDAGTPWKDCMWNLSINEEVLNITGNSVAAGGDGSMGRVGIGTYYPEERLHVVGDILIE